MSSLPENELDLEKLFLPAWAQEPASAKHYAQYEGEDRRERRGDQQGRRPSRPGGPGGQARQGNFQRGDRGDRRGRPGPGPGPRREGGDKRPFNRERPGFRRDEPQERREPMVSLPEVTLAFFPDEKGVESLSRQIKVTGRAYPLFDIARLILQKPERHSVTFAVKKKADGQVAQPLFVCALDDTLWLSEEEAVSHVLKRHFGTFYQAERTATEPPKGKYTFVAQCGMSGVILGPPNYHDYQNQLRKLHAERFARIPFDVFKARVKIVRDEEVVKKWTEDQSWKTEYLCLNMPEPLRLASREAVEKHFLETHKETIIKSVESYSMSGTAARGLRSPGLSHFVRYSWEDQRRFPLQIATVLSQQFAGQGLQFFKVNKSITHVSVARPHFLDLEMTPVSEGVKRIVEFINAHPKTTRRKLMEALAPAPAPAPIPVAPQAPATGTEAAGAAAPATAATPAPVPEPTPEQTAVISDFHWLVHQGHVIEFANGVIETAKKPLPKPPKPAKAEAAPAAPSTEPTPPTESAAPAASNPEAAAAETAVPDLSTDQPSNEESDNAVDSSAPAEPPSADDGSQPSSESSGENPPA